MAISPIHVGDLLPAIKETWTDDSKGIVDLTGATLAVQFVPYIGTPITGTGTFTITNAAGGEFTYQQSSADVAAPFNGTLHFTALIGGDQLSADAVLFVVLP